MVLHCSVPGDIGSFSEVTIEIESIRSVLEEEVHYGTKFENRSFWVGLVPNTNHVYLSLELLP